MKRRLAIAIVVVLVAAPGTLQAQVPGYEMALLPIAIFDEPVQGAHGSRWIAEFTAFNSGHQPVHLIYWRYLCLDISPCAKGELLDPNEVSGSEQGNIRDVIVTAREPSAIIHYEEAGTGTLHFQLRIRDLSRDSEDFGVELPIVREPEIKTGTVHLLDVPVQTPFRSMVRIYDMHHIATSARITIFDQSTGRHIAEHDVTLLPGGKRERVTYQPRYAQVPLNEELFPGLAAAQQVRLEITLDSPDQRLWAFVSVTNNHTQRVTVVTPQ